MSPSSVPKALTLPHGKLREPTPGAGGSHSHPLKGRRIPGAHSGESRDPPNSAWWPSPFTTFSFTTLTPGLTAPPLGSAIGHLVPPQAR